MLRTPDGSTGDQAERNLVEIELAAAIADTDLLTQQRQVARRLVRGWLKPDDIVTRQGAGATLKAAGWQPDRVTHRAAADDYRAGCKAAGVPVPGSFDADANWKHREDLDSETHRYFFRSDWNDAEVWTYKDVASGGFCVALVRRKSSAAEQYVGTICTDSAQQRACFFDNMIYDGSAAKRVSWEQFRKLDFNALVHPKDGEDSCNTCHLGNNPFIVHPKTTLGQVVETMYSTKVPDAQKFEFVGLGGKPTPWINFDAITSPGACFGCHGIPKVTSTHKFCSDILEMATNRTMPPGHWPLEPQKRDWFWPDENGCFAASLKPLAAFFPSLVKLKSLCSGRAEETCKQ